MGAAGRPARTMLCAALGAVAVLAAAACTTAGPAPLVTSEIAQTSQRAPNANELIIGVDDLGGGFNPHTLADVSPVTMGVAGLVLPSAFRFDAGGQPRPDPTLIESAEVTAQQPFTVSYQLRREASWSDGAPIAAEDFAYLAGRMRDEPGVANPAGYRLIRQVNSRSGGKQVEVVFERPYPGWRTLFGNLLPAHLLKDAPGGWAQVLETGIPVSGGPFAMRAIDPGRGVVVLERNDRYWDIPAVLDRLVLRRAEPAALVSALATGGDQLALWRADSIGMVLLRERADHLPPRAVPEPVAAELLLRPAGQTLTDPLMRAAVAAAIDLPDLVRLGSGSGPGVELATAARTLLPSQPGYTPTAPAIAAGPAATAAALAAAGYEQVDGQWLRAGQRPTLLVAAPAERPAYVAVAQRVVRQLGASGIEAQLLTPSGDELFSALAAAQPLGANSRPRGAAPDLRAVDIAVVPRPVSGDPAADLVSWYGCAAAESPVPATGPAQLDVGEPGNPSGYCDPGMQANLDDLLSGASTITEAVPVIEATLWRDLPSIPLFQHAVVLVTARTVEGAEPGSLLAGPFAAAAGWRRTGR